MNDKNRRSRAEKKNLEFDWSDKKEAKELDDFCVSLRNQSTRKMYYPGAARFQEMYVNQVTSFGISTINTLLFEMKYYFIEFFGFLRTLLGCIKLENCKILDIHLIQMKCNKEI